VAEETRAPVIAALKRMMDDDAIETDITRESMNTNDGEVSSQTNKQAIEPP
jgi:hypothetical protein